MLCSSEYCPADESLPLLITTRRNSRAAARAAGYWYPLLDDRASAYAYTIDEGFQAPELYCCVTAVDEIGSICFADGNSIPTGFVIRITNSHSSQGIYVFPDGFDGVEVISGMTMSYQDVVNKINEGAPPDKILVEQYINGPNGARLPAEYKFHVFSKYSEDPEFCVFVCSFVCVYQPMQCFFRRANWSNLSGSESRWGGWRMWMLRRG